MTRDFGVSCKGVARGGTVTWIGGAPYGVEDRPRGHVAVRHDGAAWFYRVGRSDCRAFRSWAAATFEASDGRNLLRGAWPEYRVEGRGA